MISIILCRETEQNVILQSSQTMVGSLALEVFCEPIFTFLAWTRPSFCPRGGMPCFHECISARSLVHGEAPHPLLLNATLANVLQVASRKNPLGKFLEQKVNARS